MDSELWFGHYLENLSKEVIVGVPIVSHERCAVLQRQVVMRCISSPGSLDAWHKAIKGPCLPL